MTDCKQNSKKTTNSKPVFFNRALNILFGGWNDAFRDVRNQFIEPFLELKDTTRPGIMILISLVVTWFIYVPIHELLHVAGCIWTGGTVSELVMGKEYGAQFLSQFFTFITPATTKYAGRVTGFEPNGDFGYFMTVFAPFLLTLFPGVWCLKTACQKAKYLLLGPGIVIGLASFYNLTGDFFEMGTIFSTRIANFLWQGNPAQQYENFWMLRSDDIFRLFSEIKSEPSLYGVDTSSGLFVTGFVIIIGAFFAVVLAGYVYRAGRYLAR